MTGREFREDLKTFCRDAKMSGKRRYERLVIAFCGDALKDEKGQKGQSQKYRNQLCVGREQCY